MLTEKQKKTKIQIFLKYLQDIGKNYKVVITYENNSSRNVEYDYKITMSNKEKTIAFIVNMNEIVETRKKNAFINNCFSIFESLKGRTKAGKYISFYSGD